MNFIHAHGTRLYDGDQPWRFLGVNNYYLMVYARDPGLRPHVYEVLSKTVDLGARVVRTWAFNDGHRQWHALQPRPGHHDESTLQGLDHVIDLAGRLGLRLILTLVNNWDDYGGMNQYVHWSQTARKHDDFYDDATCRHLFRHHAHTLTSRINTLTGLRYRDDPTILAWELANEPRCPSDPTGRRLGRWLQEMSGWLHELAPHQLLTTGLEGFHAPRHRRLNPPKWRRGQGTDFRTHHQGFDLASFHAYPDHWWMHPGRATEDWIGQHLDLCRDLQMPALLGEFGKRGASRDRRLRAWLERATDRLDDPDHPLAGAMAWILYHDAYPDYDGFGIYTPRDASTTALLQEFAAKLNT